MGVGELSIHHVVQNEIEALVGVGRLADAETTIDYVEEKGRPTRRSWNEAVAARGRALVAAARGDDEPPGRGISSVPWSPTSACRSRSSSGARCWPRAPSSGGRSVGRRREGALTKALDLFDWLGAALWAERAAAELARIPGRGPATDGLTETERRVAELVSAGLSNKAAAARLFVSVRAVEANLSKVYAKLGISARTQLAGRLRREIDA